jgi:hypothetical protein
MQKRANKRKYKTCSTCGKKIRHDKRTCRSQLARNGRRQRAQDREIRSPSDSVSPVHNRRRRRQPRSQEINDSLSDSTEDDIQIDK